MERRTQRGSDANNLILQRVFAEIFQGDQLLRRFLYLIENQQRVFGIYPMPGIQLQTGDKLFNFQTAFKPFFLT